MKSFSTYTSGILEGKERMGQNKFFDEIVAKFSHFSESFKFTVSNKFTVLRHAKLLKKKDKIL